MVAPTEISPTDLYTVFGINFSMVDVDELKAKQREAQVRYRLRHPDRIRAASQKYRSEHLEEIREKDRQAYYEHKIEFRERQLKRKYGMTISDWEKLFDSQGRKCAVLGCRAEISGGHGWCVDHNHETGKVRGIICQRCNHALSYLESQLFDSWQEYLKRSDN
jgi:hypothetical protein